MARARNHQSVDWGQYFALIKSQCPWSYAAWHQGLIDIVKTKTILPLGQYKARVYVFDLSKRRLKKLSKVRDHGECEWLWSHPEYGDYATPLPCLIQQDRQTLNHLRNQLNHCKKY